MSRTAASRSPATAPRTACGSSSGEDRQPLPRSLLLLASGEVTEFLHVGGRRPARLHVGLQELAAVVSAPSHSLLAKVSFGLWLHVLDDALRDVAAERIHGVARIDAQ